MSLAVSREGRQLVTGSYDDTVKLWNVAMLARGKPAAGVPNDAAVIRTYAGHTQPVFSIAMSPDQKLIASGGEDK